MSPPFAKLNEILRSSKYTKERFPITVPISKLRNNDLVYAIIDAPDRHESLIREALEIQYPEIANFHHIYTVRFTDHPRPISVKDIHARDIGRLIAVKGIVKQASEVVPKIVQEAWRCRICGDVQLINQDGRTRCKPARCLGDDCRSKDFIPVIEQSLFCDNQKIRMQDLFEGLKAGAQPESLDIEADDDLCHKLTGGDHAIITGVLRADIGNDAKTTSYRRFLELKGIEMMTEDASQIQFTESDIAFIDQMAKSPTLLSDIVRSTAPNIYGSDLIKLALLLQQVGGVTHEVTESMPAIRGDFHVLLCGDPASSKSQLLKFIHLMAGRSVFISGKATSSAGLTASVTKDAFGDGRWSLEAGALILADGRGVYHG